MEVPFDAGALKVSGTPAQLPIEIESRAANGWAAFAVSRTGTLVYREDVLKNVEVVYADENGNEEMALDSAARITSNAPSPDGRKIALVRDGDVWIYDRQRGVYTRLTNTEQVENSLVWSRDSKEIVYSRDVPQYDLFKRVADGSGPEQLVLTSANDKHASAITPDGKTVIYNEAQSGGDDVLSAPLDPADKTPPKPLIGGTGNQVGGVLSPDGRWLAYASTESGRNEIYVVPYPPGRGSARQQLSTSGGDYGYFANDRKAFYYRSADRLLRAKFDPQTGDIGKPEVLSKVRPGLDWSIAPDGRFLIAKIARGGEHRSLKVILNWPSTLNDISRAAR
jgi:serine/threonine-protein kinase